MAGKPYRSKLIPYEDYIREARRKGVVYMDILKYLREKEKIECALSTLYSFVKTRSKKNKFVKMLPLQNTEIKEELIIKKKDEINPEKKSSRFKSQSRVIKNEEKEKERAKEWDELGEMVDDLFNREKKLKKEMKNEN